MRTSFLALTLTALCFIPSVFAQEFDVRAFRAITEDLAARRFEKRTVNDEPCAIVKVVTNIQGMMFDANIGIIDMERRDDGYWLWVAPRERRLRLMAPGYMPLDVDLPEPARSHIVYELRVASSGMMTDRADLVRITFRLNQENVYIQSGNNAPVMASGRNAVRNVARGEHTFRFIKQGFDDVIRTINASEEEVLDINLTPGERTTAIALSGFVIISSNPTGAEVYLNEQRVGTTPYQGRHIAGNYSLVLQTPLYHEHATQFELDQGATVDLPQVNLRPRFGFWQVSSDPSGAEVYLDGRLTGTTPLARAEISSGTHDLSVRTPLHHEHRESFTIEDGDDRRFNLELKPAFGELAITSDPSGAKIFIDGREAGVTPYINPRQPSGTYNVLLQMELYSDSREQVTVSDGRRADRFVPLSRNFGTLDVSSQGSVIFLDGRRVGSGSYSANLPPGQYRLRATKDLHLDDEREVFVIVGHTETLTLLPVPRQGALSVVTRPFEARGAEIFLNGQKRAEITPASFHVFIGSYDVAVRKEGYLEAVQKVNVTEGIEQELFFDLQTFEGSMLQKARRHRGSKIFWGLTTGAAIGAGAYFQLSSIGLADEYNTATVDATSVYDTMEQQQLYSFIAFGAAVPLAIITIVKSSQQRSAMKQYRLTAMPARDGAMFGLRYQF
jgi:hypothetical protein